MKHQRKTRVELAEQEALDAVLRTNFLAFLHRCVLTLQPRGKFKANWHHEGIAFQLERVRSGEEKRLIINLPPRMLKTTMVSVAYTAFLLGHDPSLRIFGISYGEELAAEHAEYFRTIVESEWYQRAFPKMRIARAANSDIFTTQRGFRKATSIGATLTGQGGDIFIIDDPLKATDAATSEASRTKVNEWVSSTLMSRLDDKKNGVIIVVMQRLHMQDLTGYLLENSSDWHLLKLPAIAECDEQIPIGENRIYFRKAGEALHAEREPLESLEKLRQQVGAEVFEAQYQQSPVPAGGAMIGKPRINFYDKLPDMNSNSFVLQSWDTASKTGIMSSYSVCTTWLVVGKKQYYVLDVTRGRFEYPELRRQAIELAKKWNPKRILIEDTAAGTALVQELTDAKISGVRAITPKGDKVERLYVQLAKFDDRLVWFPFPSRAPFMADVMSELLSFPQGKTDDIVDSITQALAFDLGDSEYDHSMSWVGDTTPPFCAPRSWGGPSIGWG